MRDRTALRSLYFGLAAVYALTLCLTGAWPWLANQDNGYALQAQAWLHGHLDLAINYSQLDLAQAGGRYYVAAPPFPSLALLPLSLFFGAYTPDALLSLGAAFLAAWLAYRLCRVQGSEPKRAAFWSFFLVAGGGLLFVSLNGGDRFLAQSLAFCASLAALLLARSPGFRAGIGATACWAAAVGCEPLLVLFAPLLVWLQRGRPGRGWRAWPRGLLLAAPAVALFALCAWLNWARFGSALDFGWGHLAGPNGAVPFGAEYLGRNAAQLLLPPGFKDGRLAFGAFGGFAFYLASPLFVVWIWRLALRWRRRGHIDPVDHAVLPGLAALHLALACFARDSAGWQFGSLATVALLPYALYGLLRSDAGRPAEAGLRPVWLALLALGLGLNLIGGVAVMNHWL